MKPHLLLARLLLLTTLLGAAGCVGTPRIATHAPRGARTFALAVTVNGSLQPTPAQFAAIQAKAVQQFSPFGYMIVTDLSLAEQILRLDFTPNPNDPENSGRVSILGFRSNPLYATTRSTIASPYPTAFGFAGSYSNTNWWALNHFGYGYYGYGNSYYDGYSYSSPTLNPVQPPAPPKPTHPPYRHHPPHCPPEPTRHRPPPIEFAALPTTRFVNYPTGTIAATTYTAIRSGTADRPAPAFTSTWRGERPERPARSGDRTSSRSDTGSSRSGSSYSRSDSSYSRSDSSYSRSDSSTLYSGSTVTNSYTSPSPSYSPSSDSSSYSAPVTYSGGGGGSSGTHEAASNQKQN